MVYFQQTKTKESNNGYYCIWLQKLSLYKTAYFFIFYSLLKYNGSWKTDNKTRGFLLRWK